jgi:hypothetical protein
MATIGTFTKKDATYQGTITTLTLKAKVNITPRRSRERQSPGFPGLRWIGGDRSSLVHHRQERQRLPLGQARRSQLRSGDLRPPGRERRIPRPRLVPLIQPAPAQAGAFLFHFRRKEFQP